jgi:hypothetical protein
MNKILPGIITTIAFCLFAFAFPTAHAYATPYLQFNPTSVTSVLNNTFQVDVRINVDSNNALASDAIINYAGTDFEIIAVTSGGFFPQFSFAPTTPSANGTLEIHGYTTDPASNITGTGSFAKIVFKAKKGSGSSVISFTCTGETNNTNILTTTGTNLLASCTQINQISVNYTGDTVPTITSTIAPTLPPGETPSVTPSPTTAPSSNTIPYCAGLSTDVTIATGIPKVITISCSGVDPGGYINGAEFWFGDGSSQVITKNVGSPGTVTTTHTYTKSGLYTLECKVRDNDQVYSSLPDVCRKILTIQKPVTTKATPTTRTYVTPAPKVISIIEETPKPTIFPEVTAIPEETVTEEKTESPLRFLWVAAAIISLIFVIRFFSRRQRNPPIPPINPPTTDTPHYPEPKF